MGGDVFGDVGDDYNPLRRRTIQIRLGKISEKVDMTEVIKLFPRQR